MFASPVTNKVFALILSLYMSQLSIFFVLVISFFFAYVSRYREYQKDYDRDYTMDDHGLYWHIKPEDLIWSGGYQGVVLGRPECGWKNEFCKKKSNWCTLCILL